MNLAIQTQNAPLCQTSLENLSNSSSQLLTTLSSYLDRAFSSEAYVDRLDAADWSRSLNQEVVVRDFDPQTCELRTVYKYEYANPSDNPSEKIARDCRLSYDQSKRIYRLNCTRNISNYQDKLSFCCQQIYRDQEPELVTCKANLWRLRENSWFLDYQLVYKGFENNIGINETLTYHFYRTSEKGNRYRSSTLEEKPNRYSLYPRYMPQLIDEQDWTVFTLAMVGLTTLAITYCLVSH